MAGKENQNNVLARQRTLLANERTLLAYLRTSLASLLFGIALAKIFEGNIYVVVIGGTSVLFGAFVFLFGFYRYKKYKIKINGKV
ncbi:MAG: DUF202 domain-containing protein [Candidatus Diapherotrites archaeon]|nr:DUF202 domain-containing protein [Candidatus Diapherotrites archaeon]